jgi:hypothetical protein
MNHVSRAGDVESFAMGHMLEIEQLKLKDEPD